MATNVVACDERAQRRAASAERVAAEAARRAKETTEVTVDTGDSGTPTLESSVITSTSGDTPLGSASDGRGGGRGRPGRDDGAGSGREPAGGNDGERSTSGSSGNVARSNLTGGGTTPTAGDGGRRGGGHGDDGHGDDENGGDGGHGERVGQREAATSFSGGYVDLTGTGGGGGHGGAGPGRASTPPPTLGAARMRAAAAPIVVREKAKALKLTKFKGLDDTMPVSMWLKTVRQEVRRQAVTMDVEWNENQLYHEVASHLEGEAKRWFSIVMESVQPEEESINTLAAMLRAKYMTQRSGPEVVDLLNARRQMRGERLVDYAQALREIAERGEIGDDWQVSAFLKGMSSTEGATHVRGHRPKTLDEALSVAIPQVGDYGEGYGIRLEEAMAAWDAREATSGHGPLAAAKARGGREQSAVGGNSWNVVSGYGPGWGAAPKPPRYDTEGRPVDTGKAGAGEWWKAIPPGFQLVPAGTSSGTTGGSKFQTSGGVESGKRQASDQNTKRPAKTLKVESKYGGGAQRSGSGPSNPALATREGRLRNHERYMASRAPQRAFVPREGTECYYCGFAGHFARNCTLKQADLAAGGATVGGRERRERVGKRSASIRSPVLSLARPDPGKKLAAGRGQASGQQQRLPRGAARTSATAIRSRSSGVKKVAAGAARKQVRHGVVETGDGGVLRARHAAGGRAVLQSGDGATHTVPVAVTAADKKELTSTGAKPCVVTETKHVRFAVAEDGAEEEFVSEEQTPMAKTAKDKVEKVVDVGDVGDTGAGNMKRAVVDLACASVRKSKEELEAAVSKQLDEWLEQFGADGTMVDVANTDNAVTNGIGGDDGSPESVQKVMTAEVRRQDVIKAKVLRVKAAEVMQRAVRADEEARHLQKRRKRKEHERERRERRAARGQLDGGKAGDGAKAVVMVGDSMARGEQPVPQFVAMAADTEVTAKSDELVRVSRTRRRYEKLVRKARAREDRKLRKWLATQSYPDETYMAFVDTKRRHSKGGPRLLSIEEATAIGFTPPKATTVVTRVTRRRMPKRSYQYESGSVYAAPSVVWTEDGARPARVGRLRAVQAPAVDSLPTAKIEIGDEWRKSSWTPARSSAWPASRGRSTASGSARCHP